MQDTTRIAFGHVKSGYLTRDFYKSRAMMPQFNNINGKVECRAM